MWGHNLGVHACQKNFKPFRHRRSIQLHRSTCALSSNHDYTHRLSRFCGSQAFQCCIGLKLFLRLARAMCEGNTKFGIFQRWFATFLVYLRKDPEWCQTFTQALMCSRNKNFVEVDEKIYWVQDEIHPLLSHLAQRKIQ